MEQVRISSTIDVAGTNTCCICKRLRQPLRDQSGAYVTAIYSQVPIMQPKYLLAGVPREESAELFSVIASLSEDITVLFIEHDMELVFRLASRIIVMVGGRILLEGTPKEISADPRVREVYLGGARHG